MLKSGAKPNEQIEKKLQEIRVIITRAYTPLPSGGNDINETEIERARELYRKLRSFSKKNGNNYHFPRSEDFINKVHDMRTDIFLNYMSRIPEAFSQMTFRSYNTVVPSSAFVHDYGTVGNVLNVDSLEKTDVIDVLSGEYTKRTDQAFASSSTFVDLASIVGNTERNIVALSNGKGLAFGTGFLISPTLVLTARHCIEERNIENIIVRNNFQKQSDGTVDLWTHTEILGVVEENSEHDYAIIELKDPIPDFKPIKLNYETQHEGSSVFIHHPGGWVKKVSVHVAQESDFATITYSGFHDSVKGSSGGVYINANGAVFALHCLNMQNKTSAKFLDSIRSSNVLKALYDAQGVYTYKKIALKNNTNILVRSKFSQTYHEFLETIERQPDNYKKVNEGRNSKPQLTYHHIIPKSNLEFLWMLGQLNKDIEQVLKQLMWVDSDGNRDSLIVSHVIWSPWNLFIGPSDRPADKKANIPGFDPKSNQFWMEPIPPLSFTAKHGTSQLWTKIEQLNTATENEWMRSIGKVKPTVLESTKKSVIKDLDTHSYTSTELTNTPASIKPTQTEISLVDGLKNILSVVQCNNDIHITTNQDWTFHDPRYAINVITRDPSEPEINPYTLYLFVSENSYKQKKIFYKHKDPNAKLICGCLEEGFSDLERKMLGDAILTDQETYQVLNYKKLKLFGTYKLREHDQDGNHVLGLMSDIPDQPVAASEPSATIAFLTSVHYDNELLNYPQSNYLLNYAKKNYGIEAFDKLLDLGTDKIVAQTILKALENRPAQEVVNLLLGISNKERSVALLKQPLKTEFSSQTSSTTSNNFKRLDEFFGNSISWYIKYWSNYAQIAQFKEALQDYNIDESFDVLDYSPSDYKKKVLFHLHPDKGGNQEDFVLAQDLYNKFHEEIDINSVLQTVQHTLHKATIITRTVDTGIDTLRAIHNPTWHNVWKVGTDIISIYSLHHLGIYSSALVVGGVAYSLYNEDHYGTVKQIAFAALPMIIGTTFPVIGTTYAAGLSIYSIYSTVSNGYSLWQEYNEADTNEIVSDITHAGNASGLFSPDELEY